MQSLNFAVLFLILILLVGAIMLLVFYLLNLQRLLNEISQSNRLVEPTNVWLMFIPFFSLIYPFILYPKICDSVKNEYQSRGIKEEGDFGKTIGISMPILGLISFIPVLGSFAAIVNLVLFIIFWVKMSGYKNRLMAMPISDREISSNPDLLD